MQTICFDIGGTGCQWALFKEDKIIKKGTFSTQKLTKKTLLIKMAKLINQYLQANDKIGIASPGAINLENGKMYGTSGIKDYQNFNLYQELGKHLNQKWKIAATNDANSALLGTLYFEKQIYDFAALVTLGTGVGGALAFKNQIISGKNGFVGEWGYSNIWSQEQNISQHLSTNALIMEVKKVTKQTLNGKEIFKLAQHDLIIKAILAKWITKNAEFLCLLIYSLNLEIIYLGGGISNQPVIVTKIKLAVEKILKKQKLSALMPIIEKAYNGSDAALYGAYFLSNTNKIK